MRVRKIAKQLKRRIDSARLDGDNCNVYDYKMSCVQEKVSYIMRMTRKNYFGLLKKCKVGTMMHNLYVHNANSYYLFDDILKYWGCYGYEGDEV